MSEIEKLYEVFCAYPQVSTDSRNIVPNSIFFAIKGENFDGNQFAGNALNNGAIYAVVDQVELSGENEKFIVVDDVLQTLQLLASHHRSQIDIPVIGITGSNGKTTTKELIQTVLRRKYNVLATEGNLNNHIGVPLTLLKLSENHELAIVEMGANHIGEIGFLCSLSKPTHGLITNIGKAHLKGFGSYEGVIEAKAELYDFLRENGGTVFVNADDELLTKESAALKSETYGFKSGNIRAHSIVNKSGQVSVEVFNEGGSISIQSQLFGRYNAINLLTSVSVGRYFNVSDEEIKMAIEGYSPENNRSQIIDTGRNVIIMDAYNANPSSMAQAIVSFAELNSEKKLLILGEMLELGTASKPEHQQLVKLLREKGFKHVYLVGSEFENAVKSPFKWFENVDALSEELKSNTIQGFNILIKGSRGVSLEKCREFIP